MDSEGEMAAIIGLRRREGEESIGVRYIQNTAVKTFPAVCSSLARGCGIAAGGAGRRGLLSAVRLLEGDFVACDERENDVMRLSLYGAVVNLGAMIPTLGGKMAAEDK